MKDSRVLELLQELHNCKPATKEDLRIIKELYMNEIPFHIDSLNCVIDEIGTYQADIIKY